MIKGDKVGIVCCSNGQSSTKKKEIENLKAILNEIGLIPVFSRYIYKNEYEYQKGCSDRYLAEENRQRTSVESGTPQERAEALMEFYKDDSIKAIFDISGGDIANTILPYLDYTYISSTDKQFWGYSDLTTIINAIYTKTEKTSVLYQIRNLLYEYSEQQKKDFSRSIFTKNMHIRDMSTIQKDSLYEIPYEFYQGNSAQGIVVGGNIRCFLKLAGTEYFPDLTDKILLLEARSGSTAQILTYFSQLEQMGVFKKVNGILLGTFTQMEKEQNIPNVYQLLKPHITPELPVIKTAYIGHGTDSKAIEIGGEYKF